MPLLYLSIKMPELVLRKLRIHVAVCGHVATQNWWALMRTHRDF